MEWNGVLAEGRRVVDLNMFIYPIYSLCFTSRDSPYQTRRVDSGFVCLKKSGHFFHLNVSTSCNPNLSKNLKLLLFLCRRVFPQFKNKKLHVDS